MTKTAPSIATGDLVRISTHEHYEHYFGRQFQVEDVSSRRRHYCDPYCHDVPEPALSVRCLDNFATYPIWPECVELLTA